MASLFGTASATLPARNSGNEIGQALERCDWFVLVLSPDAVKSKWVKHELLFALNDARYENRIVPCLFKRCNSKQLSWALANFQFIDFTRDIDSGMRELLRLWGIGYQLALGAGAAKGRTKPKHRQVSRRKP